MRTPLPLTAFKNAPNPKFVQNLSHCWDKFWTHFGFGAFFFECCKGKKGSKTRPFRFLLLESLVSDWFRVSSCLVGVRLPQFGSKCEEPRRSYKIKSDVLETPVILMPEKETGDLFLFLQRDSKVTKNGSLKTTKMASIAYVMFNRYLLNMLTSWNFV